MATADIWNAANVAVLTSAWSVATKICVFPIKKLKTNTSETCDVVD